MEAGNVDAGWGCLIVCWGWVCACHGQVGEEGWESVGEDEHSRLWDKEDWVVRIERGLLGIVGSYMMMVVLDGLYIQYKKKPISQLLALTFTAAGGLVY